MEHNQKTPNAESLSQMPYSELKKIAKKHGIKGNLKAEKIIAVLSSMVSDNEDSFSTPAVKEINLCRKKKEEKFDKDVMTPLLTPRRGTYSVGSPITLKVVDEASPALSVDEISVLDMSNVTVGRGSERRLRSRKVSFLSPLMAPHTPKNSNLRMRPKTPIVSRTPLANISPFSMKELSVNLGKRVDMSLHLTPLPEIVSSEINTDLELQKTVLTKSDLSSKKGEIATSNLELQKTVLSKSDLSSKEGDIATPKSQKALLNKSDLSSKKKQITTPNFKRIHAKAFEKMESIDEYQKRISNSARKITGLVAKSKITKAKSKIPAFGGIPFIPSVSKLESDWRQKKVVEEKAKVKHSSENVSTRKKSNFDLKTSLSRKLSYKPYTGPLKPLVPSTALNTSSTVCFRNIREPSIKEPANKVVTANRLQNRVALKGVRTNKRFDLQMKNRKLQ